MKFTFIFSPFVSQSKQIFIFVLNIIYLLNKISILLFDVDMLLMFERVKRGISQCETDMKKLIIYIYMYIYGKENLIKIRIQMQIIYINIL